MARSGRAGAMAGVFVCTTLLSVAMSMTGTQPVMAATASMPAVTGGPIGRVAGDDGDLSGRRAALRKALAGVQATYEIASAKVQAAAASYVQAAAELPGAQHDLASATGSVIAATVQLDQADKAVTSADAAVHRSNGTLSAADHAVAAEQSAIADVATAVYRGSGFLALNSLLTNGSPGEVLDRFGYADQIAAGQQKVLRRYLAAQMVAKEALTRSRLAAQKAVNARRTATAALVRSKQMQAAAQKAQAKVTALMQQREAALAIAQQNKAATLAQYNQLQKENKQVEAQLAAQAAADRKAAAKQLSQSATRSGRAASRSADRSLSSAVMRGYDAMPVHGWKSSNFGMRFDPIYKRWQLHAGVDIAASGGTPIHAARSGKVIRAGWYGGYGNYTCIDTGLFEGAGRYHGKEIANCYGHQSRILVHVGEHVTAGQTIGLVGETGAATGNHLHFEVRVDGTPVQPLNWLPSCFC